MRTHLKNQYCKILFYFAIALLPLGMVSCSDDDKEFVPDQWLYMDEEYTSFNLPEVDKKNEGVKVEFKAHGNWQAELKEPNSWITITPSSGGGGVKTMTVKYSQNLVKEERSATIVLTSHGETKEIALTQAASTQIEEPPVETELEYYKPKEFGFDMNNESSKWSFARSKESKHFIVLWEAGFGADPGASSVSATYRVDVDDLLNKAEIFYETNIQKLKFANTGSGTSNLDKYKMQIYLHYTTEWMAYGGGYDDVIGALWISPNTCMPVGSTIAHEIGHSFQYQVYADKLAQGASNDFTQGFRYGYEGSNGGCSFWEQCAQWQSFQDYPTELFGYHVSVWESNYHRSFEHEWMRYASYWLQYYWSQKHGIETVAEVWKQSVKPEDALSTYMRVFCNNNVETLYEEMYEYASHMVTYDLDVVRNYRTSTVGGYTTKLYDAEDGYYQVAYASCPGTTGFNVIPLTAQAGATIKANFVGLNPGDALAADDPGVMIDGDGKEVGSKSTYNTHSVSPGWRYGFVAVVNGTAQYAPMNKNASGEVSYTVPEGATNTFFVVMGAPTQYVIHGWNEKESDDAQWPYKVKFEGANPNGYFEIDPDADPKDVTFTYDLTCDASYGDYVIGTIDLSANGQIKDLAQAFVLQPQVLSGNTKAIANGTTGQPEEGKVVLGLLQPDGSMNYTYTANVGFYCTAEGNQGSWGANDPLWFEYDKDAFIFTYGHKPGSSVAGQKYTIKPTLIYTKDGKQYKATFVLNMQF